MRVPGLVVVVGDHHLRASSGGSARPGDRSPRRRRPGGSSPDARSVRSRPSPSRGSRASRPRRSRSSRRIAASSAGRIETTSSRSCSGVRSWNGCPGSRSVGFWRSPSSPPVQHTSIGAGTLRVVLRQGRGTLGCFVVGVRVHRHDRSGLSHPRPRYPSLRCGTDASIATDSVAAPPLVALLHRRSRAAIDPARCSTTRSSRHRRRRSWRPRVPVEVTDRGRTAHARRTVGRRRAAPRSPHLHRRGRLTGADLVERAGRHRRARRCRSSISTPTSTSTGWCTRCRRSSPASSRGSSRRRRSSGRTPPAGRLVTTVPTDR